jgi:ketosteroid isomerase-like protein
MDDQTVRMALERHWDASDASDFKVEHEIYREDAVLDYPQSGELIRGRYNIHTIFKRADTSSQTRNVLRFGELSAAAISGSLNTYLPMTAYHLTQ